MKTIPAMQPNGRYRATEHRIGSSGEHNFFRVMTEKHGKLFFDSKDDYLKWSTYGRFITNRESVMGHLRKRETTVEETGGGGEGEGDGDG
jgi:hypothetical protein